MSVLLALVLLVIAAGMALFWGQRVKGRLDEARRLSASQRSALGEQSEEVQDAWLAFGRSAVLGLLFVVLVLYLLGSMVSPVGGEIGGPWEAIRALVSVKDAGNGGGELDAPTILRTLISVSVFLVVFGLTWAFLPGLWPWDRRSLRSRFLSFSLALLISATFALWLGTSDEADAVIAEVAKPLLGIIATFFSILFGAIGLWLAWKQIQRFFKPK